MAATPLRALVAAGHDVALVVTRRDRRRQRRGGPTPSPVKAAAIELGLPVTDRLEDALDVDAELGVVVAYGRLVRPEVLDRLPMVNLHFSLLPRWRGAAPVERAILAGDTETGVCLMALEEGLDTGPIYQCQATAIGPDETADQLRGRLAELGTALLVRRLARGREGLGQPQPQVGKPTPAPKVEPAERHLDWSRPAAELARVVRIGRAWTVVGGRRLLVHRARVVPAPGLSRPGAVAGVVVATGAGGLELVEVQPEGRPRMPASDWTRGARIEPGEVLGA